jgi:uncharacterized protein (DUF427 family)
MKAILNNVVIAEADREELIYIEGNYYFPISKIKMELLKESDTPYTCPWKGVCQYYDVVVDGQTHKDNAFRYPQPKESAIKIVKKDFSDFVAFWQDVKLEE